MLTPVARHWMLAGGSKPSRSSRNLIFNYFLRGKPKQQFAIVGGLGLHCAFKAVR